MGIHFHPSLLINNQTYRGDWEVSAIAPAICAGFTVQPQFCSDYEPKPIDTKTQVEEGINVWVLILIISILIAIISAILIGYRIWVKRELQMDMQLQVNSAVSQYFALSDSEGSQMQQRQKVQGSYY